MEKTPDTSGLELPPQLDVSSPKFTKTYEAHQAMLRQVFPSDQHPDAKYGRATHAEYVKDLEQSPEMNQLMSAEIFTLLSEYEKNGNVVNGKKLYDHQIAHEIWLASNLPGGKLSPQTFLLHGEAGTGKTLEIGIFIQAFTRLQMRGLIDKKLIFSTSKGYILPQQCFDKDARRRRILRTPPYESTQTTTRESKRYMEETVLGGWQKFFTGKEWDGLVHAKFPSVAEAEVTVRNMLKKSKKLDEFNESTDDPKTVLHNLAAFFANAATTAMRTDGKLEILHIPPPPPVTSTEASGFSGDATFGIPSDYIERGLVFSRKKDLGDVYRPGADPMDIRVALLTTKSLYSTPERNAILHILQNVGAVVIDETVGEAGSTWQHRVQSEKEAKSRDNNPIALGAGAVGGYYGMPHYDRTSPKLPLKEAIREKILPPVGLDIFPGADQTHYAPDSSEALDQLVTAHFERFAIAEFHNLPQPHECSSLFIVSPQQVDEVVERLQAAYNERKMRAQVLPYRLRDVRQKERIQTWMLFEEEGLTKVLVASSHMAHDSLDIPDLGNVTIGTNKVSDISVKRFLGRLEHSALHRIFGEHFRGYFRQQQFADSNLRKGILYQTEHGVPLQDLKTLPWYPGETLLDDASHELDQVAVESLKEDKKKQRSIPLADKKGKPLSTIKTAEGTTVLQKLRKPTAAPKALKSKQPQAKEETNHTSLLTQQGVEAALRQVAPTLISYAGSIVAACKDAERENRDIVEAFEAKVNKLIARQTPPSH